MFGRLSSIFLSTKEMKISIRDLVNRIVVRTDTTTTTTKSERLDNNKKSRIPGKNHNNVDFDICDEYRARLTRFFVGVCGVRRILYTILVFTFDSNNNKKGKWTDLERIENCNFYVA